MTLSSLAVLAAAAGKAPTSGCRLEGCVCAASPACCSHALIGIQGRWHQKRDCSGDTGREDGGRERGLTTETIF